ncbi:MAG: sugar phosphate isomerase/epimerase family protein [Planctomycetia bacterium]|nr:sugar phosphate isomerase/epimerase family protein [Planctomycetia bacterium]
MQRRTFLKVALLTGLGATTMNTLPIFANTSKKVKISVQLYSVRDAANKDLAGTLKAIAKMGYDGVEFAGYYGHSAEDIRKMLDDNGLVCSGTHTGIGALRGDNFERTVEFHKILGTKNMIVPGGIDRELHTVEGNKAIAEEFNQIAKKAAALDMRVGYHAHGGDAKVIEGIPAWQRFASATCKDVVLQMDVGNYMNGGGDPYKMIEMFPGRALTVHVKDSGGILGEGRVEWDRVWNLCETSGNTEWYVVEEESRPKELTLIEKAIKNLRAMGK